LEAALALLGRPNVCRAEDKHDQTDFGIAGRQVFDKSKKAMSN
jgi:hypothetical protein